MMSFGTRCSSQLKKPRYSYLLPGDANHLCTPIEEDVGRADDVRQQYGRNEAGDGKHRV